MGKLVVYITLVAVLIIIFTYDNIVFAGGYATHFNENNTQVVVNN